MQNGPVVAGFDVYEDFSHYKSGIYKHTAGRLTGGHAVKVIGWGEETIGNETIPYWIVANSWHDDWGENDASKAEEIPMEAQSLSGLSLVEYLQKNQDLFEVKTTPVRDFKYKLMDLRFMKQSKPPAVEDVKDNDDDIPKRLVANVMPKHHCSLF
ncbi:hypothetical protein TELCIR_09896 [Teladorsagia circumcincta]|uniref:Peptidase C1A papain C-terminal domain-containing protein n=1 Tax=Teladorsagia circumcincta TaxID=45464 RepID=A0A2G9UDK1_TELCI|nr:hypothetical protein TELCIR_09896 [Teladorsagia circumcincta]